MYPRYSSASKLLYLYSFFLIILTACSASEEVVVQYQYDSLGRLNQVDDTVNGNRIYHYDPAGNRTQLTVNAVIPSTSASGAQNP